MINKCVIGSKDAASSPSPALHPLKPPQAKAAREKPAVTRKRFFYLIFTFLLLLSACVSVCMFKRVYMGVQAHGTAQVWRSEDNLQESSFSFYHVGPGNQTQVIRLGNEYLS